MKFLFRILPVIVGITGLVSAVRPAHAAPAFDTDSLTISSTFAPYVELSLPSPTVVLHATPTELLVDHRVDSAPFTMTINSNYNGLIFVTAQQAPLGASNIAAADLQLKVSSQNNGAIMNSYGAFKAISTVGGNAGRIWNQFDDQPRIESFSVIFRHNNIDRYVGATTYTNTVTFTATS